MHSVKQRSLRIKQEKNIAAIPIARQSIIIYNSNIDSSKTEPITDISEFLPFPNIWKLFTSERLLSKEAAKEFTYSILYLPPVMKEALSDEIQYIPLILDM